jgi:VWFA-related protein
MLCGPLAGRAFAPDPAPEPTPEGASVPTFEESVDVSLVTLVVRVVDTWGNPILGLAPEDLRVRVGKAEVPVTALDWIGADDAVDDAAPETLESVAPSPDSGSAMGPATTPTADGVAPPGRLVVLFVQADLTPSRISGQMRLRPFTRELLAGLSPRDRVAVVSFDSHLKLWQDFAPDPEATHEALDTAMLWSREKSVPAAEPLSLLRHLDRDAARSASSPERALEVVARALEPLPGEKTLIFLGWGIGRFGSGGVRMGPGFGPAVRALREAHAAVFVLDVTSADEHSLSAGLEGIAEATGGTYASAYRLPQLATASLARAISGYYVLTLDGAALGELRGGIDVELRDHRGTVLARPLAVR